MANRVAALEVRAKNRKLQRDLKKSEKMMQSFGKSAGAKLKDGFIAATGGLLAFASFRGVAELGREALDLDKTLTRIGIQAGGAVNLDKLSEAARSVGKELALDKSEMVAVVNEIVNLEGAAGVSADKMRLLAEASVATGAELKPLSGVLFGLNTAFKFKNIEESRKALDGVIEAGKAGSVPLGEMSTVLQQSATQFARFSETGSAGAAQLASFIQIGRRGFGSAGEVRTGMKAFFDQIEQNEGKIGALGAKLRVSGKVGKGAFLPLIDIFDELERAGVTADKNFTKAFGSSEARQFLRTVEKQRKTRTVEGKELLGLDDMIEAAQKSNATADDAAKFLSSRAGRMQRSFAEMKAAFIDAFTPERIELFVQAAEKAADVVGFVADNATALVIAFGAFKALKLVSHFGAIAAAASAAADSAKDAATATAQRKVGGRAGAGQKVAGGIAAASGGFAAGQLIGNEILRAQFEDFEQQKERQGEALTELQQSSAAVLQLVEAGAVSEEGAVDPELVRSLRIAEFRGKKLSPLQEAAKTALEGFEVAEKAESGSKLQRLTRSAPERRSLVTGDDRLVGLFQLQLDATQELIEEVKANRDTSIEIGGEEVMRATQNTPAAKRAPAR